MSLLGEVAARLREAGVPSALIGVGRPGGWAFHAPLGEQQFASEDGVASAMTMARVLALASSRLTAAD